MNTDRLDPGSGKPLADGFEDLTYSVTTVFADGGSGHSGCAAENLLACIADQLKRSPGCGMSFKPTARTAAVLKARKLEQRLEKTVSHYQQLIDEARAAISAAALSDDEQGLDIYEPSEVPA